MSDLSSLFERLFLGAKKTSDPRYMWAERQFREMEWARPKLIRRLAFGSDVFLCDRGELWQSGLDPLTGKLKFLFYANVFKE